MKKLSARLHSIHWLDLTCKQCIANSTSPYNYYFDMLDYQYELQIKFGSVCFVFVEVMVLELKIEVICTCL